MQRQIDELKARVEVLEKQSGLSEPPVVRRRITREQAKREIHDLYASGETVFMSEVAERLQLPDDLVAELCHELMQEGELRVNEAVLRAERGDSGESDNRGR